MDPKKDTKKNELRIPLRQVTAYSAAALLLIAAVFLSGYFFGKKHTAEQFVLKMEQDSFADQIYSSLCALYDQEQPFEIVEEEKEESVFVKGYAETQSISDENNLEKKEEIVIAKVELEEPHTPSYYAELIGYGTRKAAESFVQKLCNKEIPVKLKVRESKTAEGKKRTWYQVVTEVFKNRENLEKLTDRIAREEKIRGMSIKSC